MLDPWTSGGCSARRRGYSPRGCLARISARLVDAWLGVVALGDGLEDSLVDAFGDGDALVDARGCSR